jgi:hypothetical protein
MTRKGPQKGKKQDEQSSLICLKAFKSDSRRPRIITKAMLTESQVKLLSSKKDFESWMKELHRRLYNLSEKGPRLTGEESRRLESMREETDSISQCLNICTDASDLAGNP